MNQNLIAETSILINASGPKVWQALVDPAAIQQYMFGALAVSDWHQGSSIVWKGEWQGSTYEDKGVILQIAPKSTLQYSHFSPLSGLPDLPENYHVVTIELSPAGAQTRVTLAQDHNATEKERDESAKNWGMMLSGLKNYVEQ